MESAYLADLESNHAGKPAFHKLKVLERLTLKLKNPTFSHFFLDKGGLEQLHNFLKKLPDGSWPLSTVRTAVLESILGLPCTEHHLKYTKLGKSLTILQNSKGEYEENKKIIQDIKEKWLRIVSGQKTEYCNLEYYEKENKSLMRKRRRRSNPQNNVADTDLNPVDINREVKMGHNFTVRPSSTLNKRDATRQESCGKGSIEIEKYLCKIRKMKKSE